MLLQSKRVLVQTERLFLRLSSVPVAAAIAGIVYLLISFIGLGLSEPGLAKVLAPSTDLYQYWDTNHYVVLSTHLKCSTFYPLWPQTIRALTRPAGTELQTALGLSMGVFLGALPLTYWVFRRLITKPTLAMLAFLLYVLNPNSIFHANGYTEAGFSALAVLMLAALLWPASVLSTGVLLTTSLLMSLMRPSLLQITVAAIGAWICVGVAGRWLACQPKARYGLAVGTTVVGAVVGYAIYGTYCLYTAGNFLEPFQAQVEWGRRFGLRPVFLLLPRSLLNDLHGFYFPFILAGLVVLLAVFRRYRQPVPLLIPRHPLGWLTLFYPPLAAVVYGVQSWRQLGARRLPRWTVSPALDTLLTSYPFWFCLLMCLANASIGFLAASNSLYSLARFVFAPPFFFIALGMIANVLDSPTTRRFLIGSLALSGLGLMHQWYGWGNGGWVG